MWQIVKVIQIGPCQAVCLPREFGFTGEEVRIERIGQSIIITPVTTEPMALSAPRPINPPSHHDEAADAGMTTFEKRRHDAAVKAEILRTLFRPPANDNQPKATATPFTRGRGFATE